MLLVCLVDRFYYSPGLAQTVGDRYAEHSHYTVASARWASPLLELLTFQRFHRRKPLERLTEVQRLSDQRAEARGVIRTLRASVSDVLRKAYSQSEDPIIKTRECNDKLMLTEVKHLTMAELEAGLEDVRRSPKDEGLLELIVRRPQIGEREILEEGELHLAHGLVGDNWSVRGSSRTADGSSHPDMQLNVMNARSIALIAQHKERWSLAGDQLFIDLDLSTDNLPPGTRLSLGSAVIEVTAQPHTGCRKFVERFGADALRFVNSPLGKQLNMRGINAKVVQPGVITVGCAVRKI